MEIPTIFAVVAGVVSCAVACGALLVAARAAHAATAAAARAAAIEPKLAADQQEQRFEAAIGTVRELHHQVELLAHKAADDLEQTTKRLARARRAQQAAEEARGDADPPREQQTDANGAADAWRSLLVK